MQLSQHFTLKEFTRSATADSMELDNEPDDIIIGNLYKLCAVIEKFRKHTGRLDVSSGYRSPEVNQSVGGSPTSAHCEGCAVDLQSSRLDPWELAEIIVDKVDSFDQCIVEMPAGRSSWVHFGISPHKGNRNQILYYDRERRNGRLYAPIDVLDLQSKRVPR